MYVEYLNNEKRQFAFDAYNDVILSDSREHKLCVMENFK